MYSCLSCSSKAAKLIYGNWSILRDRHKKVLELSVTVHFNWFDVNSTKVQNIPLQVGTYSQPADMHSPSALSKSTLLPSSTGVISGSV